MISALSIADILEKEISDISIKWPNDVLAGRKKIAGILIENSIMADRIRHSIIGIGINVNQKKYPFFQPQATSIKLETGRHSDTNVLITDLENAFIKWYNLLASNNHDMIRQSYYQLLAGFNVSMHYRDLATNKSFPAIIKGVNEDGRLVLINDQGETLSYGFREIEMQL